MAWEVFGRYFDDTEATNQDVFASYKATKSQVLLAVRTFIIIQDDPTYTSAVMEIYSETGSSGSIPSGPNKLLYTSDNTVTQTELNPNNATLDNAISEVFFEFNASSTDNLGESQGVPWRKDEWIHFVLKWTGVSGSTSDKHVSWRIGWPDGQYQNNTAVSYIKDQPGLGIISSPF